MEFFKSKYYVSDVVVPEDQITLMDNSKQLQREQEQLQRDLIAVNNGNDSITHTILEKYCVRFPLLAGYRLVREVIERDWIEVTDLKYTKARFSTEIIDGDLSYMYNRVFYHPTAKFFVQVGLDIKTPEMNDHMPVMRLYSPVLVNQERGVDIILKDGSLIEWKGEKTPEMSVLVQGRSGLSLRYSKLNPVSINFDTMYPKEFKDVSDKIVEATSDEDKTGLIILHGVPGTGKTNYLRWLTSHASRRMVFVPPEMVSHLTTPEFVSFLLAHKGLTLIVEDAEHTLSPRLGAERSIVSTILNLTDGLLGDVLRCQFICTFNTELTNIDAALLRPGRLLVRQEFRNLTVDESNNYLKSVDSDERVEEPTSLAELTNIKTPPVISTPQPKKTFGFNKN